MSVPQLPFFFCWKEGRKEEEEKEGGRGGKKKTDASK